MASQPEGPSQNLRNEFTAIQT